MRRCLAAVAPLLLGIHTLAGNNASLPETRVLSMDGDVLTVQEPPTTAGLAEITHGGRIRGLARIDGQGSVRKVLGVAAEGCAVRPLAATAGQILALAPDDKHPAVAQLRALLGPRLHLVSTPSQLRASLGPQTCAVVALTDPGDALDAVGRGAVVMCTLQAYASLRGLKVRQHTMATRPGMVVTAPIGWAHGISVGHRIPWYGTRDKSRFQYSLACSSSPEGATALAVSTIDASPMMVEETLPSGARLVALDLVSPNGRPGYDAGSKNKWHFLSRLIDPHPFYGAFVPRKLSFQDYLGRLCGLVQDHPARVRVVQVGTGAAGDPVFSAQIGPMDRPRFVFTGVIHGGEILGAYGLLRLLHVLLENPGNDPAIADLLERYGIEVLPLVNAWGYTHGKQVNSRDCDLNRNFNYLWDEYAGDGGWRANYSPQVLRGQAPFSEGETAAVRDRLLDGQVAGYIDFHQHGMQHGHMLLLPHRPVQQQREALLLLGEMMNARLAHRYLYGDDRTLQFTTSASGSARPFAENWAASRGILACCFELPGGFEDSLVLTDVVVNEALSFMWLVDILRGQGEAGT